MLTCNLIASVFEENGKPGDFDVDKDDPANTNAIWLFNENFLHMRDNRYTYQGGGSACMRPYSLGHIQEGETPRAFGIPTGWSVHTGGFRVMGKKEHLAIILSFHLIYITLKTKTFQNVTRIIFPADNIRIQLNQNVEEAYRPRTHKLGKTCVVETGSLEMGYE